MKTTKNKWMQKMKEQFILRYQAMLGVQNVESFVDKFFSERRILGIPVAAWTGLHIQLVSVCLLLGALEAMYGCVKGLPTGSVLTSMFQGIWTSALLLVVDGFCMVPGKVDALKWGMQDYLENYLQVCLEHEYHVWGKDREELRQTKAVLDAQMQVIDARAYQQQKKEIRKRERKQAKRRPEVERKVRQDVMRLKQEVETRRRLEAEALAIREAERSTSRQVEDILQGLL
jgi:uncharacterized membrane protein YgaE (UPF0421/DUF939 family)